MNRPHTGRLGVAGYVALLASLRDEPGTIPELTQRIHAWPTTTYRIVATFHRAGTIHIAAWKPGGHIGKVFPVYGYGSAPNAPAPANAAKLPRSRTIAEAIPVANMLRCCEAPSGKRDIMEASGLSHTAAKKAIDAALENSLIRIVAWHIRSDHGAGDPLPQYQLGAGCPAAKPKRVPRRIINARYWARRTERLRMASLAMALHGPAGNDGVFKLERVG